jgi:DNA-binding response OmpR family regulator
VAKILIADDEANIRSILKRGLEELGHEALTASNGDEAWEVIVRENDVQCCIFDVIMPRMGGFELCSRYREKFGYGAPVLMLTALGTTEDIVRGLEAGADDYLVKPFRFAEFAARIQALLRRSGSVREADNVTYAGVTLHPEDRRAVRNGNSINLTIREYCLLEYLISKAGVTVSREDIIRHVWGKEAGRNMNIVDVYINYLRAKIDKGFDTKLIRTVSGVGYRFEQC